MTSNSPDNGQTSTPDSRDASRRRIELRREAIFHTRDRSYLLVLVAVCTLSGLAVGFAMSSFLGAWMCRHQVVSHWSPPHAPKFYAAGGPEVPWLGVYIRDARISGTEGVRVTGVFEGSPAGAVGIEEGDILLTVADRSVDDAADVVRLVRSSAPGAPMEIDLLRDGERHTVRAVLSSIPAHVLDRAQYLGGRR